MFILGTSVKNWFNLLFKHKFDISLRYIPRAILITIVTILFFPFRLWENFRYRRKIKKTEIKKAPIFVLGHFRNGTSHLQNLLSEDKRFGYLTMAEGTFPHIFISNDRFIHSIFARVLPKTRPMDDMELYARIPGEHEWALMNLCALSPYTGIHFAKNMDEYVNRYGNFKDAPEREIKIWKKNLEFLVKKLTLKNTGKRLVLKSPLDTARIGIIREVFPNAKFVHIHRNPYDVFFSTLKMHRTNTEIFALQDLDYDLRSLVLDTYKRMYDQFFEDLEEISGDNFIQISYNELTSHPISTLEKIYRKLDLPNFEEIQGDIEDYLCSIGDYKPSDYVIEQETKELIYSHWKKMIDTWGYAKP